MFFVKVLKEILLCFKFNLILFMHTVTLVIMALVLASDILTVTFFGVIIGALHVFKLNTVSTIAS